MKNTIKEFCFSGIVSFISSLFGEFTMNLLQQRDFDIMRIVIVTVIMFPLIHITKPYNTKYG